MGESKAIDVSFIIEKSANPHSSTRHGSSIVPYCIACITTTTRPDECVPLCSATYSLLDLRHQITKSSSDISIDITTTKYYCPVLHFNPPPSLKTFVPLLSRLATNFERKSVSVSPPSQRSNIRHTLDPERGKLCLQSLNNYVGSPIGPQWRSTMP